MGRLRLWFYLLLCAGLIGTGAWGYARYEKSLRDIAWEACVFGPVAVDHVADGDSIVIRSHCNKKLEVRLLGINAKEIEHKGLRIKEECWGPEAAAYVKQIAEGKLVTIQFDPRKNATDDHDRLLGYVYVYNGYLSYLLSYTYLWHGLDLNKHLIETGYAEEWLYHGTYTRADEFLAAEKKAEDDGVGGWSACEDFKKHPRKNA